jgi:hypothetical protein
MSYQPVTNNEINEPPYQLVKIICDDFKRLTIAARFAKNIKRNITAYKLVVRSNG